MDKTKMLNDEELNNVAGGIDSFEFGDNPSALIGRKVYMSPHDLIIGKIIAVGATIVRNGRPAVRTVIVAWEGYEQTSEETLYSLRFCD